ncbi:MAG TPA: NAD-dependent epimerase/dehydratase family protein [Polyangiales bacterium]|nr:NAD-dependent epimerase/dehydratase family protein [Polyangiales bacterium]
MGERRRVLLTGATGFVGSRLFPVLQAQGYEVVGGTRDVEAARRKFPGKEFVQLDITDGKSVREALQHCSAAVYLVHSMATGHDYERIERDSAQTFRSAAADAHLERIVYLGGMPPKGKPSRHLRSRMTTGEILRGGSVPTIELQATMVIGSGSESFRMVRDLAARLPVMLLPKWAESITEPIALDDVTFALAYAVHYAPAVSRAYPLPGPEKMTARDILGRTAGLMGRHVRMFGVPVITPKLSSYWIRFVTRGNHHVTDELVEGLRSDIIAPDLGFWKLCPEHERQSFDHAARKALNDEESGLSTGALLIETAIDRFSPKRQPGRSS